MCIRDRGETALEYYGRKFTYADFIVNVKKTAAALRAAGLKKGDIATVVSVMTPEIIFAFYAADMIGATLNLVDPRYSVEGIREYIEEVDSHLLICLNAVSYTHLMVDESNKDYVRLALAKGVSESNIALRHIFRNAKMCIRDRSGPASQGRNSRTIIPVPRIPSFIVLSILFRRQPFLFFSSRRSRRWERGRRPRRKLLFGFRRLPPAA